MKDLYSETNAIRGITQAFCAHGADVWGITYSERLPAPKTIVRW